VLIGHPHGSSARPDRCGGKRRAAGGCALLGTRSMNNTTDCLHEAFITDVRTVIHPTVDSTASEYICRWVGSPELQHEPARALGRVLEAPNATHSIARP